MKIQINGFTISIPNTMDAVWTRMCESHTRFVLYMALGQWEIVEIHDDPMMRKKQFAILKLKMGNGILYAYDGQKFHAVGDLTALCEVLKLETRNARYGRMRAERRGEIREARAELRHHKEQKDFMGYASVARRHKCRKPKCDAAGDHATHAGTYVAEKHFPTGAHVVYYAQNKM